MNWHNTLQSALDELHSAEAGFMHADPEFCDYHIYLIQAAEEKVRLIIRQAREAYGMDVQRFLGPRATYLMLNQTTLVKNEPTGTDAID